jgi:hypothetical protein
MPAACSADAFRTPTVRSGDAFRQPQGVSPEVTEARNQIHAANQEKTSMSAKIGALNRANAAFWAAR